jgi:pyruvate-formate lyase
MSHADRLLSLAREARERAEEIRARAETFNDAGAREGMLRIAASYEKLAERLEQTAAN